MEVQVHHLISLGGWNDVIYLSICLSYEPSSGRVLVEMHKGHGGHVTEQQTGGLGRTARTYEPLGAGFG